ncbi:phosphoenolpyruvate carboxykinase (ATP), partial [Escherichia coli]|uniref:phosphoenolpyruvate carboxykinase (ATP) n=1 Tax=Escherichia coli TaxID=562 RepID=UPI002DB765A2
MNIQQAVEKTLLSVGINETAEVIYNPDYDLLIEHETSAELEGYERGVITTSGAVAVDTGEFTGRSPKDKYIVLDDTTRDSLWWANSGTGRNDNKPLSPEV